MKAVENRRCEVYFLHDGSFCPCCGMTLRLSPVNKKHWNRFRYDNNSLAHTRTDRKYVCR
jgi:hypothetical protein